MTLQFHNTLSNRKEEFKPITPGEVKMYNCGPTVSNYAHIGNLYSALFTDILRRVLEYNGLKVTQVMNITDIGHLRSDADEGEDKMTAALKREGKTLSLESLKSLATFYMEKFLEDLKQLNVEQPKILPRASDNIDADIELIKRLEEKGFVYKTSDGVYFDTTKDKNYGRLGGVGDLAEAASRISPNPEKRNPRDFAVWKFSDSEIGWESPWRGAHNKSGRGFPGWHIECSAMSMKYLGETFDIHTGGIDHIPIHHNNEIAQSESATGKPLAKYWLHHSHLIINGEKIAKSLANDIYLKDLKEKNISPLAYRYWLLTFHYRTGANFTYETVRGSEVALMRLASHLSPAATLSRGAINSAYQQKFLSFINDDLDTPRALALVWDLIKDSNISEVDKRATILDFDRVFGLNLLKLSEPDRSKIPADIVKLAKERDAARENKDWAKADELRNKIHDAGYDSTDTDHGSIVSRR